MKRTILFLAVMLIVSTAIAGPFSRFRRSDNSAEAVKEASADQTKTQQIAIEAVPEDGDRPWVLVFTTEDWQRDPEQVRIVEEIGSMEKLEGTRIQQYSESHPLHQQYAVIHHNDLPAILVVVPGQDGESIAGFPTMIHGSSLDLVDDLEDAIHLQPSAEDMKLASGNAEDEKGRPLRWKEPPYVFRPWLWNGRTCRRPYQPQPAPVVQPPTSAPVRNFPAVRDTVVRDQIKKIREELQKLAKGKVVEAVAEKAGLGLFASPMLAVLALLAGGGTKLANSRMGRNEDEDKE